MLLDLTLIGGTTVDDVVADLVAIGLPATASDPLLNQYGFDVLIPFTNHGFSGPLYLAWDTSEYGNVSVSRVGSYWSPFVQADFDCDGAVDGADFMVFADCLVGPDVPQPGGCDRTDLDGDGDTDSTDFAVFQQAFTD